MRRSVIHISLCFAVAACAGTARLPVTAGIGAAPALPPPETSFIPLVNVVEAKGWRRGSEPRTAAGLEVNKVAQMAQDGLARAVRPAHTMHDGDTMFALATGEIPTDVSLIGAYAAEVTAAAIRNGVRSATTLAGVRSWSER